MISTDHADCDFVSYIINFCKPLMSTSLERQSLHRVEGRFKFNKIGSRPGPATADCAISHRQPITTQVLATLKIHDVE